MGWRLRQGWLAELAYLNYRIVAHKSEAKNAPKTIFQSDREAVEWVMECALGLQNTDSGYEHYHLDADTCKRAVLLCCLGGTQ